MSSDKRLPTLTTEPEILERFGDAANVTNQPVRDQCFLPALRLNDQFTANHSFTLVGADSSVIMSAQGEGGHGVRIRAEAPDQGGNSLPGYLT